MRPWMLALLLAGFGGPAFAVEADFAITASRSLLVAPVVTTSSSLIEANVEPTKHEVSFPDVTSTEHWEQNFQLAAKLPVAETFSLRQEFRTGVQNDTVLGPELATVFRDSLAMLEKTSMDLIASEALRIAASVQEQWIANNSVPFAEIVTYGVETKFSPVKTTTVKLQLELSQRDEFAGSQSDAESYRLSLEQELLPKHLTAATGASLAHSGDALLADRESFTRKMDGSLKWTPAAATALTLGGEWSARDAVVESGEAWAAKLQKKLSARTKLELQAGYELHTRSPIEGAAATGSAWNLGANSDFSLRDDWNAGVGVRYRLREEPAGGVPLDELSLTLSVKGKF